MREKLILGLYEDRGSNIRNRTYLDPNILNGEVIIKKPKDDKLMEKNAKLIAISKNYKRVPLYLR